MKKFASLVSAVIIIAVVVGTIVTSAASGPNTAWLDPSTVPGTVTGHVQHQASYDDEGRHAMQARIRLIMQDEDVNITYTGYAYTVQAPDITNNTIRSTTKSAYVPSGSLVFEQHSFLWYSSSWGNSFEETE